jgi:hypothetical protein
VWSGFEGFRAEFADAAFGTYDEGEGESVPGFVGVGDVLWAGFEGDPVLTVVAGDVGAVGAYGDPGFGLFVVGYGAAVAVRWGAGSYKTGQEQIFYGPMGKENRTSFLGVWIRIVSTYDHEIESELISNNRT